MTDHAHEAARWLNVAERADADQSQVPALLGIGHALLAIREQLARMAAGRG